MENLSSFVNGTANLGEAKLGDRKNVPHRGEFIEMRDASVSGHDEGVNEVGNVGPDEENAANSGASGNISYENDEYGSVEGGNPTSGSCASETVINTSFQNGAGGRKRSFRSIAENCMVLKNDYLMCNIEKNSECSYKQKPQRLDSGNFIRHLRSEHTEIARERGLFNNDVTPRSTQEKTADFENKCCPRSANCY